MWVMKTWVGEASSSGKDLVVGVGQESGSSSADPGMVVGHAGPRSAQPNGPSVDLPVALDDSDANI